MGQALPPNQKASLRFHFGGDKVFCLVIYVFTLILTLATGYDNFPTVIKEKVCFLKVDWVGCRCSD